MRATSILLTFHILIAGGGQCIVATSIVAKTNCFVPRNLFLLQLLLDFVRSNLVHNLSLTLIVLVWNYLCLVLYYLACTFAEVVFWFSTTVSYLTSNRLIGISLIVDLIEQFFLAKGIRISNNLVVNWFLYCLQVDVWLVVLPWLFGSNYSGISLQLV